MTLVLFRLDLRLPVGDVNHVLVEILLKPKQSALI